MRCDVPRVTNGRQEKRRSEERYDASASAFEYRTHQRPESRTPVDARGNYSCSSEESNAIRIMLISNALLLVLFHPSIRQIRSEAAITNDDDKSFGLTPIDPDTADGVADWKSHACRRKCVDGAAPLQCYYAFKLESYYAMSKACYDCPFNITDCFRPHCIPADGVKRPILTVNRQMPGPPIEVCQGDRVIVDVMNSLHSESTTMHWHGQHHLATPFMDGVPYISQCPIPPGATFRYDYIATEIGTHFWHSHLGFQRGDGIHGPLIVRAPPKHDWHKHLYDFDEHTLVVADWIHEFGIGKFLAHNHAGGDNKVPNLLVNGLGRFKAIKSENKTSAEMPISKFLVKPNFRYRFRLINAEFLNCPIEVSVDNHTLSVISSDGRDIEPVKAEYLVSYAGERFDFIINMDQPVGNYFMRFRGLIDCNENFVRAHQVAILRYEGASEVEPRSETMDGPTPDHALRVNALNEGTESNGSISIPLLNAMDDDDASNTKEPDYQFYISYDFYRKDNLYFHRKNLYGYHQIKDPNQRLLTPQLNHISMKLPSFPLFSQRHLIEPNQFCNSSTVTGCENDYCACTHVLQVKLNSVVELVLIDEGVSYDANHPFHLHGYQFRVVAMERIGNFTTVAQVKELDRKKLIRRKLERAPLKDTVTVPDGGYTIVRFHANNPGYWFFHCHIEFHAEIGMSLIFKVGEHEEMVPVPRSFPRCNDWSMDNEYSKVTENEISKGNKSPASTLEQVLRLLPQFFEELRTSSAASPTATTFLPLSLYIFSCIIYLL